VIHSTPTSRLFCAALATLALVLSSPPPVHADGDPASDVLASQALFLPQDATVSAASAARLTTILGEAGSRGLHIRVAVVATRTDLGSVTSLYGRPQLYARFLAAELALVLRRPAILVVMPQGVGVAGPLPAAQMPGTGSDLAATAATAVLRLAAASGRPVADPGVPAVAGSSRGSIDVPAVATLAVGGLLVLAAWTASLRARPLGTE
jgi:hypothetical protein